MQIWRSSPSLNRFDIKRGFYFLELVNALVWIHCTLIVLSSASLYMLHLQNSPVKNHEKTSIACRIFPGLLLLTTAFFIASAFMVTDYKERFSSWTRVDIVECPPSAPPQNVDSRPKGTESLPRGIITDTTDLELRPLWGSVKKKSNETMNLLAITVGIKQKENVNKIVQKFLKHDFSVILFHYDGNVNGWDDMEWNERVTHIAARAQTKWWFSKRYLQPDVAAYGFIFLWDEDVDVDHFHVDRYLSIIRRERLQISQPAIERNGSEIHHEITARQGSAEVHRRTDKDFHGELKCRNISGPPCAGWVEMMVPVFSRASWRCVWHMIQNDLVIAWGLDYQLGYCAQGNRTENIGVVDAEYIIHRGEPILGNTPQDPKKVDPHHDGRGQFRQKAFAELQEFKSRWSKAIQGDKTWNDPYSARHK